MSSNPSKRRFFVLDTAAILEAPNLVASDCRTTPQVAEEVREGGPTGRRMEQLLGAGLGIESPGAAHLKNVDHSARSAGNLARLSDADRSVLALTLQYRDHAVLLSDDYTVLDVARRLSLEAKPVTRPGITATVDWIVRCSGCGRQFDGRAAGGPCPICGSELRLKPKR